MNKLIILGLLLIGSMAQAGTVKLTWNDDMKGIDGSPVTLTQFNAYWTVQGTSQSGTLNFGPPLPLPWKTLNGVSTWSKTLVNDLWEPGVTVCFNMTAVAGTQESAQSNAACNVMSALPDQPVIITIGTP